MVCLVKIFRLRKQIPTVNIAITTIGTENPNTIIIELLLCGVSGDTICIALKIYHILFHDIV